MPLNARELIARYGRSIFFRETVERCDPKRAPKLVGRELVAAMIANLSEARDSLKRAAERLREARLDGLLDTDALMSLDKSERRGWISAVETVKGDFQRATSDVAHWQEYAEWASSRPAPDVRLPVEREPGEDDDEAEVQF